MKMRARTLPALNAVRISVFMAPFGIAEIARSRSGIHAWIFWGGTLEG